MMSEEAIKWFDENPQYAVIRKESRQVFAVFSRNQWAEKWIKNMLNKDNYEVVECFMEVVS